MKTRIKASVNSEDTSPEVDVNAPVRPLMANGNKSYVDSIENRIQKFSEIKEHGFSK